VVEQTGGENWAILAGILLTCLVWAVYGVLWKLLYHFDQVFSHMSWPKKLTVLKFALIQKRIYQEFIGLLGNQNFQNHEHLVKMV
jgi:hypothetical protein